MKRERKVQNINVIKLKQLLILIIDSKFEIPLKGFNEIEM